jgi:hypothetical protein
MQGAVQQEPGAALTPTGGWKGDTTVLVPHLLGSEGCPPQCSLTELSLGHLLCPLGLIKPPPEACFPSLFMSPLSGFCEHLPSEYILVSGLAGGEAQREAPTDGDRSEGEQTGGTAPILSAPGASPLSGPVSPL